MFDKQPAQYGIRELETCCAAFSLGNRDWLSRDLGTSNFSMHGFFSIHGKKFPCLEKVFHRVLLQRTINHVAGFFLCVLPETHFTQNGQNSLHSGQNSFHQGQNSFHPTPKTRFPRRETHFPKLKHLIFLAFAFLFAKVTWLGPKSLFIAPYIW